MPLDTTNFHPQGPVKSVDMLQFYNLFTGVMTDQPVAFSNSLTVGGNQGLTTVPLRVYGAVGQNTNLIDLYADKNQAQPGFGFSALGRFAWGPGGASPQDTFMSRIATQNGHGSDTPGLLITPNLEVTGIFIPQDLWVKRITQLGGASAPAYTVSGATLQIYPPSGSPVASAISINGTFQAGPTSSAVAGFNTQATASPLNNNDTVYGCYIVPAYVNNGKTGLNAIGVYINNQAVPSGFTNNYSLRVGAPSGGTNNYSIVTDGNVSVGAALFVTGSAVVSGVIAAGPGGTGSGSAGDVVAARSANVGYFWMGTNGQHYVGFDGTSYLFVSGATLAVSGQISCGSNISANNIYYFTNLGSAIYIQWNGSAIYHSQPINVNTYVYFTDSGQWINKDSAIANCLLIGNTLRPAGNNIYFEPGVSGSLVGSFGNPGYLYLGAANGGMCIFRRSGDGGTSAQHNYATGVMNAGAFTPFSAAKLKTNIEPLADPLSFVLDDTLHAVSYDEIATGAHKIGFVADPWLPRVPEVVTLDKQGEVMALDYDRIGAITFEALKQYIAQTDARIAELERRAA